MSKMICIKEEEFESIQRHVRISLQLLNEGIESREDFDEHIQYGLTTALDLLDKIEKRTKE